MVCVEVACRLESRGRQGREVSAAVTVLTDAGGNNRAALYGRARRARREVWRGLGSDRCCRGLQLLLPLLQDHELFLELPLLLLQGFNRRQALSIRCVGMHVLRNVHVARRGVDRVVLRMSEGGGEEGHQIWLQLISK